MSSYRRSGEDAVHGEPACAGDRDINWVVSADGAADWLFTDTGLVNVLTGAVTRLPRFPEHEDSRFDLIKGNLRGIVYGDGTIFLYNILYQDLFTAAILRPGYAAWTFVNKTVYSLSSCSGEPLAAAYHNGKVLIAGVQRWCALAQDDSMCGGLRLQAWGSPWVGYVCEYCYILESRGELLWVSVLLKQEDYGGDDSGHALSLTVHALEEEEVDEEEDGVVRMRWVERDGRTLVDRILFLGKPVSIVADATQLSEHGGCAYFVFRRALFRYSFVDGEAKLVKQLRPAYGTAKECVWLQPQPAIAPIHEIRKRIETPKKKKQKLH